MSFRRRIGAPIDAVLWSVDTRGQEDVRRVRRLDLVTGPPRPYVRRMALRAAAVAVLDFLLVRILGPDLVNRHDDAALAAGVLCFLLALAVTGWLVATVLTDLRRLRHARRSAASRPIERSDIP